MHGTFQLLSPILERKTLTNLLIHHSCVQFLDKVAKVYETEFGNLETEPDRKFSGEEIKESAATFLNNIHRNLKAVNTQDHETRLKAQKKRKRRTDVSKLVHCLS